MGISFVNCRSLLSIFVSFSMLACSHQREKRFDKLIAEKNCDEAFQKIPYKNSQTVPGGQALSYGATAAAYTADVVIAVVGGTLIFTALCGPMLVASAYSHSGGQIVCIPADLSGVKHPRLGKQTYESTQAWRCPELTKFSESLRKVAGCYQGLHDPQSLKKASDQIAIFQSYGTYGACVTQNERRNLDSLKKDLDSALQTSIN